MKTFRIATLGASILGLIGSVTGQSWATAEVGVLSQHASVAPDNKQVVFSATFAGGQDLWVSGVDGSALRRLTTAGSDNNPSWSPDGKTIVFDSRQGRVADIWSIHSDGTGLTRLTSASLNNKQPVWSPDGKKIAFVSDRGGTNDIWLMNADGSSPTRLTTLAGQENHPSFSPSGDRIVFSETINNTATLVVMNADGSGLTALTTGAKRDWNPSWSIFGIAFSSNRSSSNFKLWIVQPDGSGLSQLGDTIGLDPTWTPDGRLIFSDEMGSGDALSSLVLLDPVSGAKQPVSTVAGFLTPIDIRPGKSTNKLNSHGHGTVLVGILATSGFAPFTTVDRTTITFGHGGAEASLKACKKNAHDVNGDGALDLVCRFDLKRTGFKTGDTVGVLRFRDTNGVLFEGRDAVVITNQDSDCDDDDLSDY